MFVNEQKVAQFTNQRIYIFLEFVRINHAVEVRRRWPAHFPERLAPTLTAIRKNVMTHIAILFRFVFKAV